MKPIIFNTENMLRHLRAQQTTLYQAGQRIGPEAAELLNGLEDVISMLDFYQDYLGLCADPTRFNTPVTVDIPPVVVKHWRDNLIKRTDVEMHVVTPADRDSILARFQPLPPETETPTFNCTKCKVEDGKQRPCKKHQVRPA